MPFGAEITDEGSVRFRLWAPAAEAVTLDVGDGGGPRQDLQMSPAGDGWFEHVTDMAGPGSRYRFLVTGPRTDGAKAVPDPASRYQPGDVHGFSEVIDPTRFDWKDDEPQGPWRGRPREEAIFYELHVGSFSPEGTFAGAARRLDHLAALGITAIELMPVAAFPGRRNWGYDGVLPFAPDASYGRPDDLKALVQQAHRHGLMVFLDVVYNHFGPEGNYLHLYAPQFFTDRHQTPWGAGINFDGERSGPVRDFFIQNALYWLEEYRLDGLRLDAVHAIADDCDPDILTALADAVNQGPGRERAVHLVLENDHNAAHYLQRRDDGTPRLYTSQWNDDFHHAAHLLLTGERDGYYADYADQPARRLGRCLAEGFAYQGEPSAYRDGAARGEPSASLPPTAFINLIQNHDQVGNRAFGERIGALASEEALRAMTALLLLAPSPPLLFMGQEFGADTPFLFFCDFGDDLAESVTEGRRREFARFERFADDNAGQAIPDPNDRQTFERSRLDWSTFPEVRHRQWLQFHRLLLQLRHARIVPRLAGMDGGGAAFDVIGEGGLQVRWRLGDGSRLTLFANLAAAAIDAAGLQPQHAADRLYLEPLSAEPALRDGRLPPWTVAWYLQDTPGQV
jgi:malto-oligosyltrehalose trehalohydrolase